MHEDYIIEYLCISKLLFILFIDVSENSAVGTKL